ncbi:hypothetical protein VAFE106499_07700 [Vagococcus fessus]
MINLIFYGVITLAILSLGLPLYSLLFKNKTVKNRWLLVSSFILCPLSLFSIVLYCYFLVRNTDIATLEDTISGLIVVSSIVFIGTTFLNTILFLISKKNSCYQLFP